MPDNLETNFLKEVRKLKQKRRKLLLQRVGLLLLLVVVVSGLIYLWHQGNPAISATTLLLIVIGLILIVSLLTYFIKNRSLLSSDQSSGLPGKFWQFNWLKRIKIKYLLGWGLLLVILIYQSNPSLFNNSINGLINSAVNKPMPPTLASPWPWKDNTRIHPVVANMPSNVETTIESVAKYIAQNESDPYLRVKAIHDYVISRVTYDLDVLQKGIRPPQDAQTVFSSHKAVCEGYANLFMALGRAIDIDIVYVTGKIRRDLAPIDLIPKLFRTLNSDYDWTNHAWNAVKILNNWQLVDTTWDDGDSTTSEYSYSAEYLAPPPQVMITSHFPDQVDWQLLQRRENYNTFEQKPILTPRFFIDELKLISPTEYQTNVEKVANIRIISSPNYDQKIVALFTPAQKAESSFWDLLEDNQDTQSKQPNFKRCQSQTNATGETQISCQFPNPGDYQVYVFSLERQQKVNFLGQLKFRASLR